MLSVVIQRKLHQFIERQAIAMVCADAVKVKCSRLLFLLVTYARLFVVLPLYALTTFVKTAHSQRGKVDMFVT